MCLPDVENEFESAVLVTSEFPNTEPTACAEGTHHFNASHFPATAG